MPILQVIMHLNILSWNVRGIMSSALSFSAMLDKYDVDVACITEHKLLQHLLPFCDSIRSDYKCTAKAEDISSNSTLIKCGKGGVAIFCKSSLMRYANFIDDINSDRVVGI